MLRFFDFFCDIIPMDMDLQCGIYRKNPVDT